MVDLSQQIKSGNAYVDRFSGRKAGTLTSLPHINHKRNKIKRLIVKTLTTQNLSYERLHAVLTYFPETGGWKRNVTLGPGKAGSIPGTIDKSGYRVIKIDGTIYKSSRLAALYMLGYFPENDMDHKNRIRDDDRWENIREVSRQCNSRNCGIAKNNATGVTGVGWHEATKKWRARIRISGKHIYLGIFKTKREAAQARWEAEVKYGFPNCNTTSSAYLFLKESA